MVGTVQYNKLIFIYFLPINFPHRINIRQQWDTQIMNRSLREHFERSLKYFEMKDLDFIYWQRRTHVGGLTAPPFGFRLPRHGGTLPLRVEPLTSLSDELLDCSESRGHHSRRTSVWIGPQQLISQVAGSWGTGIRGALDKFQLPHTY